MRHGLSLLTVGIGWVLFTSGGCTDETTNTKSGTTPGTIAYCNECHASSDCKSPNVCKVVQGSIGVCVAATDTSCCENPDGTGNCYTNLGASLGSGGSAGGGIIGSGGKGGRSSAGAGGTGGTFGTAGTGATTTGSNLGRACVKDTDCADSMLTCLTNDGLNGDGPAKGICTASCTSTSDCLDVADNSYCVPFSASGDMYCVEGCTEGTNGVPKCHEREEVACSLVGLIPTGVNCTATSDCNSDELCDSTTSQCGTFVTGCLPTCGGDYDCGDGQYCDFSSGFCVAQKPTGLPLGSPCTPPTGTATDACDGFCLAGEDPTKGTCSALCTLNSNLTGCGWDGKGAADNACLFATILSGSDAAQGDVGICGTLCDCNAQCTLKDEYCVDESMGQVNSIWGRPGYCRPLQATETVADTFSKCPAGTSGGTGGTSSNGGEAGQTSGGKGGTSSKEAGAGGQGG
ncbi:MAG TPA: hypothetical protein VMI54_03740 [Polyangiaceae bacterium]|nr:hypothetical protein [Polyangiaceae bacterium]